MCSEKQKRERELRKRPYIKGQQKLANQAASALEDSKVFFDRALQADVTGNQKNAEKYLQKAQRLESVANGILISLENTHVPE